MFLLFERKGDLVRLGIVNSSRDNHDFMLYADIDRWCYSLVQSVGLFEVADGRGKLHFDQKAQI
jgi:hypothetical protein